MELGKHMQVKPKAKLEIPDDIGHLGSSHWQGWWLQAPQALSSPYALLLRIFRSSSGFQPLHESTWGPTPRESKELFRCELLKDRVYDWCCSQVWFSISKRRQLKRGSFKKWQ